MAPSQALGYGARAGHFRFQPGTRCHGRTNLRRLRAVPAVLWGNPARPEEPSESASRRPTTRRRLPDAIPASMRVEALFVALVANGLNCIDDGRLADALPRAPDPPDTIR